jgi:ComF family protein
VIRAAQALANSTVRALLAPSCAACDGLLDRPLDGPICAACWRAVSKLTPPLCVRCGDALLAWRDVDPHCPRCRRHPPPFVLARSAGVYDGALREIIHAFKFGGRRAIAAPLAALMRNAGVDVLAGADVVVPVPLHPWRAFRRGFNQADDLARALGLPVRRVLCRWRLGTAQSGLPAARRHANVRRAFALSPAPWARLGLRGCVVVLVDDVMTTGATLDACARVLAAAGVRDVRALTAARAVARRPLPAPPAPRLSTARR